MSFIYVYIYSLCSLLTYLAKWREPIVFGVFQPGVHQPVISPVSRIIKLPNGSIICEFLIFLLSLHSFSIPLFLSLITNLI